jgi:hypothetical protein
MTIMPASVSALLLKVSQHFEIRFAELAKDRRGDGVLDVPSFPGVVLGDEFWTFAPRS